MAVLKPFKDHWQGILLTFYRETKMKTVDKAIFPSLIKKIGGKMSSDNLISGFRGARLWPLNCDAGHKERSLNSETEQSGATLNNENINSPRKILRESIIIVIALPMTKETSEAIDNFKRKWKKVQAKTGEVLATPEVLERLENEHKDREKTKIKPSTSKYGTLLRGNKKVISEDRCKNDESDDNENDDTACIVCNQLLQTYSGKKSEPDCG